MLKPETEIMKGTPWSRIRWQNSVDKEFLEIVGNGKPTGSVLKGDNCSFRHDVNKRAKMTQPNASPNSFMQQDERKASRTRSPRGKSPSGEKVSVAMQGKPQGTCTNPFCEKNGTLQNPCSTCPKMVADLMKSAFHAHHQLEEQPSKRSKNNDDKSAVAMLNKHELYDRTVRPVGNPLFAVTHVTSEGMDLLCATHQKHGNCLSVCRRRRCPIEWSDPLEIDRGDPVSTETQKHRSGLCSTFKKGQILAECQAETNRLEFQAAYDRRSFLNLGEIIFSFILNLLHFLLHFFHNLEGSSNIAYFAWKEMDSTDESHLSQVMSPNPQSSRRLMSSPSQSPWPSCSSPSTGSSRTWSTMTPRSRRCFKTHTECMSITPSEKVCLSVSRRLCPRERGDPLWRESGAEH